MSITAAILDQGGGLLKSGWNAIAGGTTCSDSQKRQKEELAQRINSVLDSKDRRDLVAGTESNVSPDAVSMAEFYYGGRDCKHKNVSPGDQQFLNNLMRVLRQRERDMRNSSPISSGGGTMAASVSTGMAAGLSTPVVLGSVATIATLFWLLVFRPK